MRFNNKNIIHNGIGRAIARWMVQGLGDTDDGLDVFEDGVVRWGKNAELRYDPATGVIEGPVSLPALYGNGYADDQQYTLADDSWTVLEIEQVTFEYPTGIVDVAENTITLPSLAMYAITYAVQFDFGGSTTLELGVFNNGVLLAGSIRHIGVSQQQNEVTVAQTMYVSALAGETIDIRVRAPGGSASFEVDDYTLGMARLGAAAPPPGSVSVW